MRRTGKCFFILGVTFVVWTHAQEVKRSLEEGIPVVYNSSQPVESSDIRNQFILVPDLKISSKGKGKKGNINSVSAIKSDDDGNIYLMEMENRRILIFSKNGKCINSFYLDDSDIQEDEISREFYLVGRKIVIIGRKYIIFYSKEGELIEKIRNPLRTLSLVPDSAGNYIGISWQTAKMDTLILMKYDALLWPIYEIDRIEWDEPFKMRERERFPPGFVFALASDDKIIWGRNSQYVINVINKNGQLLHRIIKAWEPIEYTESDLNKFLLRQNRDRVIISELTFPKYFPSFGDIHTDEEGRIYVGIFDQGRDSKRQFDVFDASGRYVSKIKLPNVPFSMNNGMLYCSEKNRKGIQMIYRFKILWE